MQDIFGRIPFYDKAKEDRYLCYAQLHEFYTWADIITYVNIGLDKPFYSEIHKIQNPESLTLLVNKYRQLDCEYIPEDLEVIEPEYNPDRLLLRHDARIAFEIMCEAAAMEGISLEAISTFRSYPYQKEVYYRKMTSDQTLEKYQKERDKVSARPGHSEHQTGLAVDINDLEEAFEATPAGKWLAANSYQYGFLLRYPKGKESITGYSYEPWHFRYLGYELAESVYHNNLTYDEYYARYIQK